MRVERRRRLVLLAGAVTLVIAAGSVVAWSVAANRGDDPDDLLPNLVQAAPADLSGRTGGSPVAPKFFLGFESAAANLGTGPVRVLGSRKTVKQERMTLTQQIERTDGSTRVVPLRATLRYVTSKDHSHWHVLGFMRYELRRAGGATVGRDRKTGFCLGDRYRVDLSLPGRSPTPRYPDRCGRGAPRLLKLQEGISVGWGDNYAAHLEGQELDITSLAGGRYVLIHRVNASRDIRESDYSDNASSIAIDLDWPRGRTSPPRLNVVARCPGKATCP